jgi:hypothetical protein
MRRRLFLSSSSASAVALVLTGCGGGGGGTSTTSAAGSSAGGSAASGLPVSVAATTPAASASAPAAAPAAPQAAPAAPGSGYPFGSRLNAYVAGTRPSQSNATMDALLTKQYDAWKAANLVKADQVVSGGYAVQFSNKQYLTVSEGTVCATP